MSDLRRFGPDVQVRRARHRRDGGAVARRRAAAPGQDGPASAQKQPDLFDPAPPDPAREAVDWALEHLSERDAVFSGNDLMASALAFSPGAASVEAIERTIEGVKREGRLHDAPALEGGDGLATDRTVAGERETVGLMTSTPLASFIPMLRSVDATLLVFPEALMSPRWFRSISMTSRLPSTTSNVTFSTGMALAVIEARPSLRQSSAHPQKIDGFRVGREMRHRGPGTVQHGRKQPYPVIPSADRPAGANLVSLTPVLTRHHSLMRWLIGWSLSGSIDVLQAEFETAFVPVAGRVSPSGITGQVVNSVNETSSYVVGSMHQGMQYVRQYMVNTLSHNLSRYRYVSHPLCDVSAVTFEGCGTQRRPD